MSSLLKVFVLLLDEIILVALVLFTLWMLGIRLPMWALISLVVALGAVFLGLYRFVVPVLNKKQMTGHEGMIGLQGKVVKPLTPEGVIKVQGELWKASSTDASIDIGEEAIVVGLEGFRLIVRRKGDAGNEKVKAKA